MSTPNERLAELAAGALVTEGLIPPNRAGELANKLAGGTMKEQDWRLLLELGMTPRKGAGNGGTD